jgi:lipopolysaccharide/colanic/teichoic acid biosynthesis glycosyltransferase
MIKRLVKVILFFPAIIVLCVLEMPYQAFMYISKGDEIFYNRPLVIRFMEW